MATKGKSLEESKKKKVPFNVLRKGAIAGLLGLTIGFGCLGLAGCSLAGQDGKDGTNGKDGAQWYSGIETPTTQGVNGDFYLDTDDYILYQKTNGEWKVLITNFGKNGQDGTNIYVGYDGYVWQDGVRTTFKLDQDTTGRENVVEDTIGAYTTMGYWQGEYVDLSTNTIALLANYKPNAKLTQYSGTKVTEIQVVAESVGTLHIGTAKVADVVSARTTGTTYTANTTSHNVVAGVNTITLDLTVAEDETIVIGGNNSTAKIYVVKNLPVSDEQGNYALMDGTMHTDVISKTGDYADTLAVRVEATATTGKEVSVSLTPALKDSYTSTQMANNSIVNIASTTNTPYIMKNNSQLANKTITKIGVIVKANNATSGERPYLTVYKVKNNFVPSETNTLMQNVIGEPIKLYFPANTTTNAWAYAECEIKLGADETLAWGGQGGGDTLAWGYAKDRVDGFYNNKGTDISTSALIFDIYVQDFELNTFEEHLNELAKKEQECVLVGCL